MSYSDAPERWREVAGSLREKLAQVPLKLAVPIGSAFALALLLVIYLLAAGPNSGASVYPLRLALPTATLEGRAATGAQTSETDQPAQLAEAASGEEDNPAPGAGDNRQAFSSAFRDLDRPTRAGKDLKPGQVIPVDYDISRLETSPERYDRSDGSLTVRKPLFVDGVSAGPATIRIEEGAQILIATKSVAQALGERANSLPKRISGALASGTGYIPFYELRGAGIEVEYDPVKDRVSLSTKS